MMMNKALKLIGYHNRKYYKRPFKEYGMDKDLYKEREYKYQAANDILNYLNNHRDWEPLNAIEEFRYTMDTLATATKSSKKNYMFSVAYDVATDILDMLLMEV